MQRTDLFWIASFILGFLFSFAVLNVPPGIGLFVGVNALVACLVFFGRKNDQAKEIERSKESVVLLNVLTGFYVLMTIPYLYRLDYSIISALVFTHVAFLIVGALYFALPAALHIIDLISLIISPIAFGLTWMVEGIKSFFELFKENANVVKFLLKLVLYGAGSLLVFILFAKLLAAADVEFKTRIDAILESLSLIEVMQRTVVGVVMSFVAAGLLTIVGYMKVLPMFGMNVERAKLLWTKAFTVVMSKRSDALLPVVVTTPVLFLFALYVWVQFKYLFGQDISAILMKYSFAEYARRGFIELLVVGVLTYPLLSWSMHQSKSEWKLPRVLNFFVNTGIVSMLVVMLYSLITRMNLYMQTYGPSVLRMYVIIGAVFVGVALIAYELLAIAKVATPGYSVFKGRIMSDYVIVAILTAFSLLGAISLVPWNTVVTAQVASYYESTKKIDVFQLYDMPLEAVGDVYKLGKKLQQDGLTQAGLLLQAHATQEKQDYDVRRNKSLFTKIGGFNVTSLTFPSEMPSSSQNLQTQFNASLATQARSLNSAFAEAIARNDFESARSYYDPEMKSNDIKSFSDGVYLGLKTDQATLLENDYGSSMLNGGKVVYMSSQMLLSRTTLPYTVPQDTFVSTNMTFRNGRLVITDSSLILAYLPDAISKDGVNNIYSYGYSTYCAIPNLEVIFSSDMGCRSFDYNYNSATPVKESMAPGTAMGIFKKSDFLTK